MPSPGESPPALPLVRKGFFRNPRQGTPISKLSLLPVPPTSSPGPEAAKEACWLDSGAPLSVVPFHVHNLRLVWQPVPGIKTTWANQPCDLGLIDS
jgi:hypothetical protein